MSGALRRACALSIVSCLAACGSDDPAEPALLHAGRLRVRIAPDPARLEIGLAAAGAGADDPGAVAWQTLDGARVADGEPPHVFAAVRTARATYEMAYGSFQILEPEAGPWRGVESLADLRATSATTATFTLRGVGGVLGTGAVSIAADDDGDPRHVRVELIAAGDNRMSIAAPCAPGEHFLGLGGQSFAVDHRGQTVALWVQEDGIGKLDVPDDDYGGIWFLSGRRHSTHTPMPIATSSRGVTVAVDTDARAIAAVCSEGADVFRFETWEPRLDLQVFVGDDAAGSIGLVTGWTGRPPVPPRFAFAPWLDAIYGQANVRRVADRLREVGAAVSVIWTEDWRGGADGDIGYALDEDWRVDRVLYPDFEGLAAGLHGAGFQLLAYHNTFLDTDADVHAEALGLGHSIHRADGTPYLFEGVKFRPTTLLDLSSPDAVAWAKAVYAESLALGVDGWMADYGEWLPADAVLDSGQSAELAHNRYPVEWARLNRELLADATARDGRPRLTFMRAAWLGSQPLIDVLWAGDQQTDFSIGDGMPSVIPMMIGLGVTGFPYVGHDIAGYMSSTTTPVSRELWFRWVTFGALSPVMRTHHGRSARENWGWESDPASTAHLVRWTRLHMKLVPYLESIAHRSHDSDGLGLVRPVALVWPDAGDWAWTTTDQYVLGDRILVAPVVTAGATARLVALPPGRFYPLLGGPGVDGGQAVEVAAGLEDVPAFVAAGTLLLLYPDGVDTVVDAPADPAIVTSASIGGSRDLWLWPGTAGSREAQRRASEGPAGSPSYAWSPRPTSAPPPTAATWNGSPVSLVAGDGFVEVTLVGSGTLVFDGGGQLDAVDGEVSRTLRVRLHAP
jgi:alpha-glucosidase